MATLDIKFSKFDNRPWGFRLAGGSDFPEPLTVIRVSEGSLAECMGLKVGDVLVKLNDQPVGEMTHGQAHEALTLAGNNFVIAVRRTEDPSKAIEGIGDKIEPYMLPIEEILFAGTEEQRESTPEVSQIEDESAETSEQAEVERYPEKPRDINSDPLPKTDLTEEEIAQLILDEEEVLNEKGVLGVNFKKIRPRAPLLRGSAVFRELQNELGADPEDVQERKHQSTFLKKPERPAPLPKASQLAPEDDVQPYRVVIKKQPKRTVSERLQSRGLLDPSRARATDSAACSEVKHRDMPTIGEVPEGASLAEARRQRLCRRARYAERCLGRALACLRGGAKPRLLPRAHYFRRIVGGVGGSIGRARERKAERQGVLGVLALAALAGSLRDAYDAEILHRGSSRRNSRRTSACRRDSGAVPPLCELPPTLFPPRKGSLQVLQSRCAEGRRKLSLVSSMLADKVSHAMRTDLARGLAYAMLPCASALAFFVFSYAKRYNNNEHRD